MRLFITVIVLLALNCFAQAATTQPSTWQQPQQWGAPQPKRVHIHHRHKVVITKVPESKPTDPQISRLASELEAVKRELAEVREQVRGQSVATPVGVFPPASLRYTPVRLNEVEAAQPKLASFPDLRLPVQPPALPLPLSQGPDAIEEIQNAIAAARAYLVRTAIPGFTMTRQGPAVSIGRLHPALALRLAEAIKTARAQGLPAAIFSAYRPPAFGIGGFGDKFLSMHSYGLAVDIVGIGGPGTVKARHWETIVQGAGLFLPYGSRNPSEFNHVQLIGSKMAWLRLRKTITAAAPKDLREMWLASGVKLGIPETAPIAALSSNKN